MATPDILAAAATADRTVWVCLGPGALSLLIAAAMGSRRKP